VNDRVVSLAGALAALLFAIGLFLPHGANRAKTVSRPLSHDRGEQGLAAADDWLRQSGIEVVALRDRYTALTRSTAAGTGNLLVIAEPSVYPPRPLELSALKDWISRGNDLLLLESIASRPAWSLSNPQFRGEGDLFETLDLRWTPAPEDQEAICGGTTPAADAERARNSPVLLKPHPSDANAPLLLGIHELRIKPEEDGQRPQKSSGITYRKVKNREIFDWLCDVRQGRNALWQFRLGRGRIWVSSYPQLFANRNLAMADNARLLANLVAISATGDDKHGGSVVFDDMHQGDSKLYDPEAFFNDSRLHVSLWLLLAIWLLYLLGYSNRFTPPRPLRPGVTPSQFVESIGSFFGRHLNASAGADLLLQQLQRDLCRRLGVTTGRTTLDDLLDSSAAVDAPLRQQLHEAELQLRQGRSRDLRPLARVIHQIRKKLQ
jgi:hypothetical protein